MTLPIKLRLDAKTQIGDLVRDGGQFEVDSGLETAVIISLFTRRYAEDGDILPDSFDINRRGWWADAYSDDNRKIGSWLWLLRRSKATRDTINAARVYTEDALAWMVEDGLAKTVDVIVEKYEKAPNTLAIQVTITRDDKTSKYEALWEVHLNAL